MSLCTKAVSFENIFFQSFISAFHVVVATGPNLVFLSAVQTPDLTCNKMCILSFLPEVSFLLPPKLY